MPYSRRRSSFATSRSPWSTNSIASACTSGSRPPRRGGGGGCGGWPGRRVRARSRPPFSGRWAGRSGRRNTAGGRRPIDTRVIPHSRLDQVIGAVGRALAEGRRVYWVCPLVEVTENTDLAAAEERFAALKERFGAMVDLVHGRMKGSEKDLAM